MICNAPNDSNISETLRKYNTYGFPSSKPAITKLFQNGSKFDRLLYITRVNQQCSAFGFKLNPSSKHFSSRLKQKHQYKVVLCYFLRAFEKTLMYIFISYNMFFNLFLMEENNVSTYSVMEENSIKNLIFQSY